MPEVMGPLASNVFNAKYSWDGTETWEATAHRVATNVMAAIGLAADSPETRAIENLIATRKFIPGGRYLYSAGREFHQTQNCILLRADDSAFGWGDLLRKATLASMSGAGIGIDYSDIRPKGSPISKTGGLASGPCSLMHAVNEVGRQVKQGGNRRAAIWAGLRWDHDDIMDFIHIKDHSKRALQAKKEDNDFPLPMELTNVSVLLNDEFFDAYHNDEHEKHELAHKVYDETLKRMLKTAEPGFSVDVGKNAGETLRNACTEVTSADDSDICNLGSLNMSRFDTLGEFVVGVWFATLFLLAGTVYSDLPYEEIDVIRTKNRRLGLGLMGMHEWLLQRGKKYGPDVDLGYWLEEYAQSTFIAKMHADRFGLTAPVKTRAIAPTGTIGIIGETTTGIEPIFCVSYIRRWSNGPDTWAEDYVVDPTAKRFIDEEGMDPTEIGRAHV